MRDPGLPEAATAAVLTLGIAAVGLLLHKTYKKLVSRKKCPLLKK